MRYVASDTRAALPQLASLLHPSKIWSRCYVWFISLFYSHCIVTKPCAFVDYHRLRVYAPLQIVDFENITHLLRTHSAYFILLHLVLDKAFSMLYHLMSLIPQWASMFCGYLSWFLNQKIMQLCRNCYDSASHILHTHHVLPRALISQHTVA